MSVINIKESKRRKEEGIKRSIEHADKEEPSWSARALNFFINYSHGHSEFMTEDVRIASEGVVPDPPDSRAWGHVARTAKKLGFIEFVRYGPSKTKTNHRGLLSVWKSTK